MRTWTTAGRWVFLVAVLIGTVLAFRGHGEDVLDAIGSTPPGAVLAASGLVVVGLLVTSVAWLLLLRAFGHDLAGGVGRSVFFVGQLGKYVPGGVWSIGAHAHLARDQGVPVRVTASTSLVFLGLNLATASVVVGAVAAGGADVGPLTPLLGVLLVLGGLCSLLPAVVSRLADLVAGSSGRIRLGPAQVAALVALMTATWLCYAGAVVALVPSPTLSLLPVAAGAFALAYAVGVVVVVAPAGVGAREVTLVALLSPVIGVPAAGAVTVLTRLLHTGADLLLAAVAWGWARAASSRVAAAPTSRAAGLVTERPSA